jgi:hypothetical protein
MTQKTTATTKTAPPTLPRFLAYGLTRADNSSGSTVKTHGEFVVERAPIGSSVFFQDYDGVVLRAGAYDLYQDSGYPVPIVTSASFADLDLRLRELATIAPSRKPVIFLVSYVRQIIGLSSVDSRIDLFRRYAEGVGLHWASHEQGTPLVESYAPEFKDYIGRYGTGYVQFHYDKDRSDHFRPLCERAGRVYGLVISRDVFVLPSIIARTEDQVDQIVEAALTAVLAYRKRMSSQMPEWVNEFVFTREGELQTRLEDVYKTILDLEEQIDGYAAFKGVLCCQSEPLVKVVSDLLRQFFGIALTVDDKRIEDATLRDDQGNTLAVFEIKGVKRNFQRDDVNQVDSHRERLELSADTPGILIMNTLMGAACIKDKDQVPHPDIIKKARDDRVLLVRTLDLLRFANAVEEGGYTKEQFRQIILGGSGWLKVEGDRAELVGA